MLSRRRRFAAIVTPSLRHLLLLLLFSLPPSPVCTAAVAAIDAVLSLLLLPSSRLTASVNPIRVRASDVAAAVAVVSLLPPSYHKPSLCRRRRCYLVAAVAAEPSLHRRRCYLCHLVSVIAAV